MNNVASCVLCGSCTWVDPFTGTIADHLCDSNAERCDGCGTPKALCWRSYMPRKQRCCPDCDCGGTLRPLIAAALCHP